MIATTNDAATPGAAANLAESVSNGSLSKSLSVIGLNLVPGTVTSNGVSPPPLFCPNPATLESDTNIEDTVLYLHILYARIAVDTQRRTRPISSDPPECLLDSQPDLK